MSPLAVDCHVDHCKTAVAAAIAAAAAAADDDDDEGDVDDVALRDPAPRVGSALAPKRNTSAVAAAMHVVVSQPQPHAHRQAQPQSQTVSLPLRSQEGSVCR